MLGGGGVIGYRLFPGTLTVYRIAVVIGYFGGGGTFTKGNIKIL